MTDQAGSDQVGTGQAGTEQRDVEQLGTERTGAQTQGSDRAAGTTMPDRGSENLASAAEPAPTGQTGSGDLADAAEESRTAEKVRGRDATDDTTENGDEESRPGSAAAPGPSDADRQSTAEDFAREHDPAKHDVSAGEEFRQSGDWTADEAGGPQVWDAEGNLVEGSTPGSSPSSGGQQQGDAPHRS